MEKQRDNHIEQNVTEQNTTEQGGIYRKIRDFALDETGVGVIELVLILVVLVSLVIVFKKQINTLLENIFKQINTKIKRGLLMREKGESYRLPCDDPGDDHDTFAGYGRVSPVQRGQRLYLRVASKFSNGVF